MFSMSLIYPVWFVFLVFSFFILITKKHVFDNGTSIRLFTWYTFLGNLPDEIAGYKVRVYDSTYICIGNPLFYMSIALCGFFAYYAALAQFGIMTPIFWCLFLMFTSTTIATVIIPLLGKMKYDRYLKSFNVTERPFFAHSDGTGIIAIEFTATSKE